MSQLLSARLQGGIRFLQHRLPADSWVRPRGRTCSGRSEASGLTCFAQVTIDDLAPAEHRPPLISVCPNQNWNNQTAMPFWPEPISAFGSFTLTVLAQFTWVGRVIELNPGPP